MYFQNRTVPLTMWSSVRIFRYHPSSISLSFPTRLKKIFFSSSPYFFSTNNAISPIPNSGGTLSSPSSNETLQSILNRLHIIQGDARSKAAYTRGFTELSTKLTSSSSFAKSTSTLSTPRSSVVIPTLSPPIPTESVLITDPPYCILHRRRKNGDLRDPKPRKRKLDHDIVVKYNSIEEYREFTYSWLVQVIPYLAKNAPLIIWTNALGRQPIINVANELGYSYVYGDYLWAKRTSSSSSPTGNIPSTVTILPPLQTEINLRVFEGALIMYNQPPPIEESTASSSSIPYHSYYSKPWSVVTDYHDTDDLIHEQLSQNLYNTNSNSSPTNSANIHAIPHNLGSQLMDEVSMDRQEQVRRTVARNNAALTTSIKKKITNDPSKPSTSSHPHRKPFSALAPLLLTYTKPNDIILDPFSGTNAIVFTAARLQRYGLGIDLRNRIEPTTTPNNNR